MAGSILGQAFGELEARVVPTFGLTGLLSPISAGNAPIAEVAAGSRLASFDSTQSALLNGLLASLVGSGTSLTLTVADYNGLANGDLNLGHLLGNLQATLGLATPEAVWTANLRLGQIVSAAQTVAAADGLPAVASAFAAALPAVNSLLPTVRLGDLFQSSLPIGALAQAEVKALDWLVGSVQLYNEVHGSTSPGTPSLLGTSVNLGSVLGNVALKARAIEAPTIVVGPAGTQFYSAAIRAKFNVDLVDVSLSTSGILAPIRGILGATANATAAVGQLNLFVDVARGSGSIASIDALTNAISLQATPSVADLYIGSMADGTFFDRNHTIDPTADLTAGSVGTLGVSVLGIPTISADITLRSVARGSSATAVPVDFTGTYPQTATVGSSSTALGNLLTDLLSNLSLGLTGLGALNSLTASLSSTLGLVAQTALQPALNSILGGLVDPAMNVLGVGIGELDLAVLGVDSPNPGVAVDDSITAIRNESAIVAVMANDVRPAPGPYAVSVGTPSTHGSAVAHPDGTITYAPTANYHGNDSFTYVLTDGFGRTSTATVSVFVSTAASANGAPTVRPDSATTAANTGVTVAVLANDTDPEGDPLTVVGVGPASHGAVVANANGTITYTPAPGFQGVDTFTYAVDDGLGGVGLATVTVIVGSGSSQNGSPTAAPDARTTLQDTAVTIVVLSNDSDPDGHHLQFVGLSDPAHGTATLNPDGTILYTPNAGFYGHDQFAYTVIDGHGGTAGAVVAITVLRANQNPVATDDSRVAISGSPTNFDVRSNDTDADGDALAVVSVTQPLHGTVAIQANGTLTYTATAGYVGSDSFTYTVDDGFGGTATGTVNVTVNRANANPVAVADSANTIVGQAVVVDVVANDTDGDGDPLTVVSLDPPAHGSVALNPDGTIAYTPVGGYIGSDSFGYAISDGFGGTATGTVNVTIARGNTAPVANADSTATVRGVAVSVNVVGNDIDADGDSLTVTAVSQGLHGSVVVEADGTVTYTPSAGYVGSDSFTYTASDGYGGTATGTVNVTVDRGNLAPTANADSVQTLVDRPVTVFATANDTDGDDDPLVVTAVTQPTHGTSSLAANGTIRYVPAANFRGVDSFAYTVDDAHGGTATATITVFVGRSNLPPIVWPTTVETAAGRSVSIDVLRDASDPDGDPLSILGVGSPSHGSVSVNPDGTIAYTPDAGFVGSDTFTYTADDGQGGTATQSVYVSVRSAASIASAPPPPRASNSTANPAPPGKVQNWYVVGADTTGGPRLKVYGVDGSVKFDFFAFEPEFRGGANAVLADFDGDGIDDIAAAPGFSGGPRVRIFSGVDLHVIADFFAFEPSFRGGAFLAAADLNRDGIPDLVVSAGQGGGPRVLAIDGTKLDGATQVGPAAAGAVLLDFFAGDGDRREGSHLAAIDLDGDGRAEIATAGASGTDATVRIWDPWTASQLGEIPNLGATTSTRGVWISGFGTWLAVGGVSNEISMYRGMNLVRTANFDPFQSHGVRAALIPSTEVDEPLLVIGATPGGSARIQLRHPDGQRIVEDYAFEEPFRGGVFVG